MIRNLKVKKNWGIFYSICLITSLILPYVSIEFQIYAYVTLAFLCLYLAKSNGVLHPLSWFPLFYMLYGISFVVYEYLEGNDNLYLDTLIPLSFVGFLGFLTPLVFVKKNDPLLPKVHMSKFAINLVWGACIVIASLLILYVLNSGISSKRDFLDSIGKLGNMFIVFSILPLMHCINVIRDNKIKVLSPYFIITIIVLLIGFGVTGERDYIFKFFLFMFLIFYSIKSYKISVFILVVSLAILLMPLSQAAKGYLILSEKIDYSFDLELSQLFYNDFYAPGRTLNYMVEKDIPLMYGETFLWDIKRFFNFIFVDQQSTGAWFNESFRGSYQDYGNSGWGFSLVAEANMNFGKIGIFFIYMLIGFISGIIYKISNKNLYFFLYYLLYIVTTIYVTRADFANYLSLNFKINVAIVLLIYFALYLLNIVSSKQNCYS